MSRGAPATGCSKPCKTRGQKAWSSISPLSKPNCVSSRGHKPVVPGRSNPASTRRQGRLASPTPSAPTFRWCAASKSVSRRRRKTHGWSARKPPVRESGAPRREPKAASCCSGLRPPCGPPSTGSRTTSTRSGATRCSLRSRRAGCGWRFPRKFRRRDARSRSMLWCRVGTVAGVPAARSIDAWRRTMSVASRRRPGALLPVKSSCA
jgi:hypothetical protein